jgi:hypothetical protein
MLWAPNAENMDGGGILLPCQYPGLIQDGIRIRALASSNTSAVYSVLFLSSLKSTAYRADPLLI